MRRDAILLVVVTAIIATAVGASAFASSARSGGRGSANSGAMIVLGSSFGLRSGFLEEHSVGVARDIPVPEPERRDGLRRAGQLRPRQRDAVRGTVAERRLEHEGRGDERAEGGRDGGAQLDVAGLWAHDGERHQPGEHRACEQQPLDHELARVEPLDPQRAVPELRHSGPDGTIIIRKDAVPDGPQDFSFNLNNNSTVSQNFVLDDDSDPTVPSSSRLAPRRVPGSRPS